MRVLELVMTGSAQQVFVPNAQAPMATPYVTMMIVQPATAAATIGDNTVTATKGIVIPAATAQQFNFHTVRGSALSQYWIIGTASDKVEILYETSQ